jgi:adenine phosphoribosyltransferase
VRKPGKLPPPLHTVSYTLEYGEDSLQMASYFEGHRVLVVDDVLATGGTLRATCNLCEKSGHTVAGVNTLINLTRLNQFEWQGMQARCPFSY